MVVMKKTYVFIKLIKIVLIKFNIKLIVSTLNHFLILTTNVTTNEDDWNFSNVFNSF